MQESKSAVVVGAGLVGALWTVFLARRGYQVKVFERRPDMRSSGYKGGRSINLAMSERGWRAIEKAGIRDKIEKVAIPMPGRMIHNINGQNAFQPYGKENEAIYSVSRGGLNLELLRIAGSFPNVEFNFEHQCLGADTDKPQVSFLDHTTGQTKTVEAPLIFATDGAHSAIRYSLQRTDRFNYRQFYLDHGYKELTIPPAADGKHRINPEALHIWPRGNFMMIALPNADGSFTATLFLPFEGDISFQQIRNDEDIIAFFQRHFPDTIELMPGLVTDFNRNPVSSLVTVNCEPWQWQGRILLLGDSAHAIVPFYGQGMNAGFEDCTILDDMLDEMGENWLEVIPAFSRRHTRNGHAIAELAQRNFIEMRDLVADPKFLLRKKITAHLHEKYPADFTPVYSMVTFSNTPYHQALKEDDAQNRLFESILAIPDIESVWNGTAVDNAFKEWLKTR